MTDAGEEFLRGGDAAGFKAGDRNGHYLQNRWSADVQVLEIGTRAANDAADYPGIDMVGPAGGKPAIYTRSGSTPYKHIRRRAPDV